MKNKILDWYFNTDKFIYGSKVFVRPNERYSIFIGRGYYYSCNTLKGVLIKSTNNYFLKLIFYIFNFQLKENYYYRNSFSGSKNKKNWKKIHGNTHLAWHTGGAFNNEDKHITKVSQL